MANYTEKDYDPSTHGYWRGTIDNEPNFGYPLNYYYADTMRSLFIGFGNFFNDIKVVRYNKLLEPVKIINVPIKFGPRNKSHDFRTEQESDKKYYLSMPNLTYRLEAMSFASDRAKGIHETRAFYNKELEDANITCDMADQFWSDIQPTPYNFTVTMEANCEKMTDAEQIVEQICVRFNPACFMDLKEFWFFNKRRSIKIKMDNTSWNIESNSMGEEDWRKITVSFTFTIEGFLYKPIKDAQIIQRINTYLTLNKGDYLYHGVIFGNTDGSLKNEYNFEKIYQTKVGPTFILDGNPVTNYNSATSAYITTYNYKPGEELTTYDEDAKLLKRVITRWIPSGISAEGPMKYHKIPKYNEKGELIGYEPEAIRDKDGYLKPNSATVSTTYTNEWLTEKEYISLSGFGHLEDPTVKFDNKVLYDQYDKPYSAYYSQYNEDGTYTTSLKEYNNKEKDYYYNVNMIGIKPQVEFSGSKYNVTKSE